MTRRVTPKRLLAALAVLVITAGAIWAYALWRADEELLPATPPHMSKSEESAKLNQAYVNWVRNGRVAEEASDADLLAVGYAACKLDADPQYTDTIIVYNIEKMYTNAGKRILDGVRQFITC